MTTPANDLAKNKRDMSPEALALVERVQAITGEVQSALEDKIARVGANLAKAELLTNPDAIASLKSVIAMEEELRILTEKPSGSGSLIDRIKELESAQQRIGQSGKLDPDQFMKDPRAEAFLMFQDQLATNSFLDQQLRVDPRLTVDYNRLQEQYLRLGDKGFTTQHARLAGKAQKFAQGLLGLNSNQLGSVLTDEAVMALSSDFAPGAGIFIAPTMEQRIIKKVTESSALLGLVGQKSTTSNTHEYTYETGQLPATNKPGERETRDTDNANKSFWKKGSIAIHEDDCTIQLTRNQVEDAGRDVVAEIEDMAARAIAKVLAQDLVNGSGVNEIQGFMTDTRLPIILTGHATQAPSFRLMQMTIDLLTEYLPNASFALGVGMLMAAMLERDGVNRPLWEPSQKDGTPSLLHGYRWTREPYFDRHTTVTDTAVSFTTGSKIASFGDHAQAYWYVRRRGLSVLRDEITQPGFIKYIWFHRHGGGLVHPDAVRVLKVGT